MIASANTPKPYQTCVTTTCHNKEEDFKKPCGHALMWILRSPKRPAPTKLHNRWITLRVLHMPTGPAPTFFFIFRGKRQNSNHRLLLSKDLHEFRLIYQRNIYVKPLNQQPAAITALPLGPRIK